MKLLSGILLIILNISHRQFTTAEITFRSLSMKEWSGSETFHPVTYNQSGNIKNNLNITPSIPWKVITKGKGKVKRVKC